MSKLEGRLEFENAIKHEIEHVFGRRILSSRDCIDLSEEIFRKTEKQLNPNTLRRIFGLVKAEYPPSHSTLAILSKYCGFHSVDDIYQLKQTSRDPEFIEHDQLLNYLISLFRDVPVKELQDKTFISLVKQTISFLNQNPVLGDKFLLQIAKAKSGQDFYFEYFVNVDKLNSYYGSALRYYQHEKLAEEGAIFAHSIHILKNWLNGNDDRLLHHAGELFNYKPDQFSAKAAIMCRYFAAKLFHAHVTRFSVDEILIDIYKYYSSASLQSNPEQLVYFEYVVSEALVLTGHYHDALYYLGQYRKNYSKAEASMYFCSLQNFKLIEAFAHLKINHTDKATVVFDQIRPADFCFLSKKMAGLMYMYLANELKRKNTKSPLTMEALIVETGFLRLRQVLL